MDTQHEEPLEEVSREPDTTAEGTQSMDVDTLNVRCINLFDREGECRGVIDADTSSVILFGKDSDSSITVSVDDDTPSIHIFGNDDRFISLAINPNDTAVSIDDGQGKRLTVSLDSNGEPVIAYSKGEHTYDVMLKRRLSETDLFNLMAQFLPPPGKC